MLPRKQSLIIVDERFPTLHEGGFGGRRYAENTYFLLNIDDSVVVCPPRTRSRGRSAEDYAQQRESYLERHPQIAARSLRYARGPHDFEADLAYCVFAGPAHRFLRYFEAARTPFAFTLYPGGGLYLWGPKKADSDQRIARLFASPLMRTVFVHHRVILEYLKTQDFVDPARITFFNGGFVQLRKEEVRPRSSYGVDRQTCAICFVANKYDPIGAGKGYDVFVEAAHLLRKVFDNVEFHVVGDWSPAVVDVSALGSSITFHGYRPRRFFPDFYARMDAIISPTRLDVPKEGKFDGFPLVTDAGYCGVAMFVSDPLKQNRDFVPGQDIEVITPDAADVAQRVSYYIRHPDALRQLGENGQRILQATRDMESKLAQKASVLRHLSNHREFESAGELAQL